MSFTQSFLSVFPVPKFLDMPAGGLDISDHSLKYVEFRRGRRGLSLARHAFVALPEGAVSGGTIAQKDALIRTLSEFRQRHGLAAVRASLPEEPAYVFTAWVPAVSDEEIRGMLRFKLEENVPIAPSEAVLDFDEIRGAPRQDGQKQVAVSVAPERVAQEYAGILEAAGLTPLSLEIEAQAVAAACVPHSFGGSCMTADIGRGRSCISVVVGGTVRFTATVDVGGDSLTDAMRKEFPDLPDADVQRIKNEQGLSYTGNEAVEKAFLEFARAVRNEIERYYIYWQTHEDAKAAGSVISKIFLSGGHANVAGLPEYLSRELFVPTERADVWANAFSLDDEVPDISYRDSLSYASAIGLALSRTR